MANPLLEVKEVRSTYGDIVALWDVSIEVDEGAIGANGAGKTTLLKTISGLVRARSGSITFDGESITHLKPQVIVDRGVVHVPEGRRLFSDLTVLENLKLGAYLRRAREHYDESLEEVFHLFHVLKNRTSQKAGTLSGGEQQMLAIGRAIMARPKLIMMDEPSLGLSPIMTRTMFDMIHLLNGQGATILLVEQNVHQALNVAHKAYVLKTGHIVKSGQGKELMEDPEIREAYLGEFGGTQQ